MKKIIENIDKKVLAKTVERCRERNIIVPTFEEMRHPDKIPEKIKKKLKGVGFWDVNPINLFRITWRNDPKTELYGDVNTFEIPSEITGVKARIIGMVGKYFPTGAHKVGAAFGCLAPRLVSGSFDPTTQKAVWPSTGNYCRGGAFDGTLLGCTSVAILPEEMSRERFDWLKSIGAEIIATPGCESNVKEIYDACWDIRKNRKDCVIFNQFDEFGNPIWHYHVTAKAIEEHFGTLSNKQKRLSGFVSATGSAGTIGAGDYLKKVSPSLKIAASEALQCPTLLLNGFGGHRIEGIGDKHVPWVHNSRNTDMVVAIDDEDCMRLLRLFNEPSGHKVLKSRGVSDEVIKNLNLMGISSISNLVSAVKMAKYYEMDENDVIYTMFTDSAEMYTSRVIEEREKHGEYGEIRGNCDLESCLYAADKSNLKELSYYDRKAIHNLKYFTWVEQQGKESKDLNELWKPETWDSIFAQVSEWDDLIREFNDMTGLLKAL